MDRDLVEQARKGDREAFTVLVHQVSDSLYAGVQRILRGSGLAEDGLQNALVLAWRRLPKLRTRFASKRGSIGSSSESEPAYSPDGNRIAFVRSTGAGDAYASLIGIRDLATGAVTLLEPTRTPFTRRELILRPSWSPDGRQIIFSTMSLDPKTDGLLDSRISIVNADGTGCTS